MGETRAQELVLSGLARLGTATIGQLSRSTGLHRRSVKLVLERLERDGLVTTTSVANTIVYAFGNVDAARRQALAKLEQLERSVPRLQAAYDETKDSQVINVLHGPPGLRALLVDEIIKGVEVRAFKLSPERPEFAAEFAANDERRARLKIPLRVLTPLPVEEKRLTAHRRTRRRGATNAYVYGNKVTLVHNGAETSIISVKIPEVTRYFTELFEDEWRRVRVKEVERGTKRRT